MRVATALAPRPANRLSSDELHSLDQYLAEVRRYPLLKGDEEIALARRIREGDEDAANELVSRNLRFVISVAKKYRGCGLPFMDLISEGNTGLLTAAHKFDPERGVKFISYAVWWVRQAMLVALARQAHVVRIPVGRASDLSSLARAAESLRQKLGREPLSSEVAVECGLPKDEVQSFAGLGAIDVSLDAPLDHDGDRAMLDQFVARETPDADEETIDRQLANHVQEALRTLPPREANVLRLHFGLDGEKEHSLEKIGSMLGITRERVRQIRDRALRRLRTSEAGRALSGFAA